MYLLDTNVISELRKPKPHDAVLASVSLGEIQAGIEITREQRMPPRPVPSKPGSIS